MSHNFEPQPHEKAMIDVMLKGNTTPKWIYEFNKFLIEERTTGEIIKFVDELLHQKLQKVREEERERIYKAVGSLDGEREKCNAGAGCPYPHDVLIKRSQVIEVINQSELNHSNKYPMTHTDSVEAVIEELDSLANTYGWHHNNCFGHAHHPSCPVIKLRRMITTLQATQSQQVEEAVRKERERIKREITKQTLLNDGTDTFVKLGEALWVCDSIEDREAFTKALTPNHQD